MKILKNTIWTAVGLFGLAALVAMPAAADQVILDDLIVDGSACIGQDCVNGESFGFDTIRIKENNLRIKAQDTSSTASFPTQDWQLTFNDSTNGGLNRFSVECVSPSSTNPFTIEGCAPSHSLYVDDGGRIGFGTNAPVVDLHVKSGNTPTLRLEQDGSSGFTAQTWDVAGNEANFFIRDATNGSTLPFRIFPGAPSNALNIEASGDVGFGTTSPERDIHVVDGTATIRLESTGATNTGFNLINTAVASPWNIFSNGTNGSLTFSNAATGGGGGADIELLIDGTSGDVTIAADLTVSGTIFGTVSSSRSLKTAIEPVDTREVLSKVAQMPMAKWNYNLGTAADRERHMGPMAEDFHSAFGLGRDAASISLVDYSGVALAAIQGLAEVNEEKDARIRDLEETIAALAARIEALESGTP